MQINNKKKISKKIKLKFKSNNKKKIKKMWKIKLMQ